MTRSAKATPAQPQPRGRGLTAKEAALYLGVKVSTLSAWRSAGKGPRYSCALGRDPRYAVPDLEEFLWGAGRVVQNSVQAKHKRRELGTG
jgi:hypothetical protein